ncbi:unnamed protein product [Arabidopsis lyrata]|nr:unnamed protein product [Arabidopsis lyrata]
MDDPNNILILMHSCVETAVCIMAAGSSKHGHIFGLGALIEALPSVGASSSVPQTSEEVETITHRLQEMETDLKKSLEENLQTQKRLEAMEKCLV